MKDHAKDDPLIGPENPIERENLAEDNLWKEITPSAANSLLEKLEEIQPGITDRVAKIEGTILFNKYLPKQL
ncbi:hypothetical protein BH11PAT3_BH11PAT3_1340 [soil metagenome]